MEIIRAMKVRTRLSFHSYTPGRRLDLAGSLVCVLCSLFPPPPNDVLIPSGLGKQGQIITRQRDHCLFFGQRGVVMSLGRRCWASGANCSRPGVGEQFVCVAFGCALTKLNDGQQSLVVIFGSVLCLSLARLISNGGVLGAELRTCILAHLD
jgi:hypothetical protein